MRYLYRKRGINTKNYSSGTFHVVGRPNRHTPIVWLMTNTFNRTKSDVYRARAAINILGKYRIPIYTWKKLKSMFLFLSFFQIKFFS